MDTLQIKLNIATELAFNTFVKECKRLNLDLLPAMGLMYLPSQHVTQQFKEACGAVARDLEVRESVAA